jgi:hypothetical protein
MDAIFSEAMLKYLAALSGLVLIVNSKLITLVEELFNLTLPRFVRYAVTFLVSVIMVFASKLGLGPQLPWQGDPPTLAFVFSAAVMVWVVSGGSLDLLKKFFAIMKK